MIEAAVAYYEGTGKRKLLDSMIRLADLICRTSDRKRDRIMAIRDIRR